MAETTEKCAENSVPKSAASVILLRDSSRGPEVYLLRRHRKAGFMASSYVFPGGICDEGEDDLRLTAVRELFEESGILLSQQPTKRDERQRWRDVLNASSSADQTPLPSIPFDVECLQYYSHWITPTVEKRRYSAQFFLARMPEGQVASPDNRETVDEVWITPKQALEQAKELRLPPPQLRTFWELAELAKTVGASMHGVDAEEKSGVESIFSAAKMRNENAHAILPCMAPSLSSAMAQEKTQSDLTLLLPWDEQYTDGHGDLMPMPTGHPLAYGPSRFVLSDGVWNHRFAPVKG